VLVTNYIKMQHFCLYVALLTAMRLTWSPFLSLSPFLSDFRLIAGAREAFFDMGPCKKQLYHVTILQTLVSPYYRNNVVGLCECAHACDLWCVKVRQVVIVIYLTPVQHKRQMKFLTLSEYFRKSANLV